nr:hypothetical protein [Tanacetum cinerariifolium]
MCIQSWGRSSYARALVEVRADVELKDNIMVAMPKLVGGGILYVSACGKVFGHVQDECPKNINLNVVKNMKKPGQATRGVLVGPKYEKLIIDGKISLVDDADKPLKKVVYPNDHDSEDEVESVDMARFMASEKVGFGTNSLLEQWMDTYGNADYDYDPYNDDMYEG